MREVKLFLKQVAYGFNGPVISILGLKQLIIWFFYITSYGQFCIQG